MNRITHIQIKTIIPLEYNEGMPWEDLKGRNEIFGEDSILKEVGLDAGNYNDLGKKVYINDDKGICIAKVKNSVDIGLYQDRGVTYTTRMRINDADMMKFSMDDIFIFFHCFRAYLVLAANIPVIQWIEQGVNVAHLYSQCREYFTKNLVRRTERTFCYENNNGRHDCSYKDLAENICEKITVTGSPDLEHIYSQCNLLSEKIPEGGYANNLIQELIFSSGTEGNMDSPANTYLNGSWQATDHKSRKCNKLFWGYGDKQFMIVPNTEFTFTNGPSSGFYKSINKNYMALYTFWIDSREELLRKKGNSQKAWENVRALLASLLDSGKYKHINDIFTAMTIAIVEKSADIAVPLKDRAAENDYIFVSYSHRDFVKVYCDLYYLSDKGVPIWYDRGLYENADEEWDQYVASRLESPKCKGVLFYISGDFMLSKNVEREVATVLSKGKPYVIVSLSNSIIPGAVLKEALTKASWKQVQDGDFMKIVQTMANAFPNNKTVLSPQDNKYHEHLECNVRKCLSRNFESICL